MSAPQVLKEIYLFKSMDTSELNRLSEIVTEQTYSAGQDVFSAGDAARSFYVIRMGTIKISSTPKSGEEMNITTLGTGSHFGELPIVDQGNRSANAQATEKTTLLEIDFEKLKTLLSQNDGMAHKFYRDLARYLAGRLRETTQNLQNVKELKLKHF